MNKDIILTAAEVVGPAILAIFGFFMRSYFRHLEKSVAKIEGHIEGMRKDLRDNTVEITKASSELRAVWRYIDNSHERASDNGGGTL